MRGARSLQGPALPICGEPLVDVAAGSFGSWPFIQAGSLLTRQLHQSLGPPHPPCHHLYRNLLAGQSWGHGGRSSDSRATQDVRRESECEAIGDRFTFQIMLIVIVVCKHS